MGTLKQASKILSIFEDTPIEQVQVILASGPLADLRDFNIAGVNRDEFRRLGGLKPLAPTTVSSEPRVLWALTSDGRSAAELIRGIEANGRHVGDGAKDVMSKPEFVTTNGVTYRLVGICGHEFADGKRTTRHIFAEAARRGYSKPPAEAAALLREKFTQEELGYPYVVIFHEPIRDSSGYPDVLGLDRDDADDWLDVWYADPSDRWDLENLFVFLAPQVSEVSET